MSMALSTGSASRQQSHSPLHFTHPSFSGEDCRYTMLCFLEDKHFLETGDHMTPVKEIQEVWLCEHSPYTTYDHKICMETSMTLSGRESYIYHASYIMVL